MNNFFKFMSKKYFFIMLFIAFLCPLISMSYSNFVFSNNNHKASELIVGKLLYSIEIDGNANSTISVAPGDTECVVTITSINSISTMYKLLYSTNANIDVKYNLDENDPSSGEIVTTKSIKLKITNSSASNINVSFIAVGGYSINSVNDILDVEGYTFIANFYQNILPLYDKIFQDNVAYADNVASEFVPAPTGIDYKYSGGEITVKDSINNGNSTITVESPGSGHFYSSSYTFDRGTGQYSLTSPTNAYYSSSYSSFVGKYSCLSAWLNMCEVLYYVNSATSTTANVTEYTSSDSTFYNGNGLYYTTDPNITNDVDNDGLGDRVYFYRGRNINNNLIFGEYNATVVYDYNNKKYYSDQDSCYEAANSNCRLIIEPGDKMCWRILKINEDGTIRLIYTGVYSGGACPSLYNPQSIYINFSYLKANYGDFYSAYIGYMYGTVNSNTYALEHANTNDSEAKKTIDNWYVSYLQPYSSYLRNEIFCNDRSIESGTGIKMTKTNYNGSSRIKNGTPSYKCAQVNDRFSLKVANGGTSGFGNNKLTYPIGMPSADELTFVGASISSTDNGTVTYTATPYQSYGYLYIFLQMQRLLFAPNLSPSITSYALRPVISIDPNILVASGTGIFYDPYILITE